MIAELSTRTFARFKYAEEYAQDLLEDGHLFRLSVRPDVEHEDDGEVYVYDEFVVEDLGPRELKNNDG